MRLAKVKLEASTNSSSTNTFVIINDDSTAFPIEDDLFFILLPSLLDRDKAGDDFGIDNKIFYARKNQKELFTEYFTDVFFILVRDSIDLSLIGYALLKNKGQLLGEDIGDFSSVWIANFVDREIEKIKYNILGGQKKNSIFNDRFVNALENFYLRFVSSENQNSYNYYTALFSLLASLPHKKYTKMPNFNILYLTYKWLLEKIDSILVIADVSEDSFPTPSRDLKSRIYKDTFGKAQPLFSREIKDKISKIIDFSQVDNYQSTDTFAHLRAKRSHPTVYKIFENQLILSSDYPGYITVVFDLSPEELQLVKSGEELYDL